MALCLFVWAAMASASAPRVLVLPFAVNAPEVSAQLAGDVPALVREAISKHGFVAIPTSAGKKGRVENELSARRSARAAKARYAVYGSFNQIGEGFSLDMNLVGASSRLKESFHTPA